MLTAAAIAASQLITAIPVSAEEYSDFTDENAGYTAWREGDAVDTEVVNFLAVEQTCYPQGILLSWNNPDDEDIEEARLFCNGSPIAVDTEWNLEAGAFNRIAVDMGEEGDVYTLEIVKDGDPSEYEAIYAPLSSSKGNWTFTISDTWGSDTEATSLYGNGVAYINTESGYDDDYSITFRSNRFQTIESGDNKDHNQMVSNDAKLKAVFTFPMELSLEEGGEYQVRYMVKTKSAWALHMYARNRTGDGWNGEAGNQDISRNSDWTLKTNSYTHDGANNGFIFSVARPCDEISIDNFEIGTIEGDEFVPLWTENFRPVVVPTEPINFFGSTGKGDVWAVSWQNPDADVLEKIELYTVSELGEEFVTDSINVSASTRQSYEIPDAEGVVKAIFHYNDGKVIEMFATNQTKSAWGDTIQNWNLGLNTQQTASHTPGMFIVDESMSHTDDGTASAKFVVNQQNKISGTFTTGMYRYIPVEPSTRYKVSLWARSVGTISDIKIQPGFSGVWEDGTDTLAGSSGKYEWNNYTKYITTEETQTSFDINFNFEPGTTGFWIDDLEFYKVDEEGNPIGDNLAENGDVHEYDVTTGAPLEFEAIGGDREVTLTWENDVGYDFVNIYQLVDDEYAFRGTVPLSLRTITFTNLERDTEYEWAIAPSTHFGVCGDMIEGSARTLLLEAEMTEPTLSGDALTVGENTVSMTVKNNTSETPISVEMLVAVYKDGVLEYFDADSASVSITEPDEDPETLSVPFDIGDDGEYTVRVMVVDSRSALNSYFDMITYSAQAE